MGASLVPCSDASECCGKDRDVHSFHPVTRIDRPPGFRLDIPVAATDQPFDAPKGAGGTAGPSAAAVALEPPPPPEKRERESEGTEEEDDVSQQGGCILVPPSDSGSEGGAGLVAAAPEEAGGGLKQLAEAERPLELEDRRRSSAPEAEQPLQAPEELGQAALEPDEGVLVIEFDLPNGSRRTVDFSGRTPPLGLDFSNKSPIPVYKVKPGGVAEQLGIKPGWIVKTINGQSTSGMQSKQAVKMLADAASKMHAVLTPQEEEPPAPPAPTQPSPEEPTISSEPPPVPGRAKLPALPKASPGKSLRMSFLLPNGSLTEVDFTGRSPPLGMDFDKTIPVTVKTVRPGGHGESLGVCKGWQITHVNDMNVKGKSAVEVFKALKAAVEAPK